MSTHFNEKGRGREPDTKLLLLGADKGKGLAKQCTTAGLLSVVRVPAASTFCGWWPLDPAGCKLFGSGESSAERPTVMT